MKNLLIYYILIITPLIIIVWVFKTDSINSSWLTGLIFFYVFIYRTYIDGKKLADKNIIKKKDIWKMVIPGKNLEYFVELYLK